MSIIDTFNASDYIFIFIGSFLLTLMITPFISLSHDGWEMVIDMVQLYVVTLVVLGVLYGYTKSKSSEATELTQDKIYMVFFLVLAIIVITIISRELFAIKHTEHGFILTIIAIVFVLICVFVWVANSAITERYGLNQPMLFNMPGIRY